MRGKSADSYAIGYFRLFAGDRFFRWPALSMIVSEPARSVASETTQAPGGWDYQGLSGRAPVSMMILQRIERMLPSHRELAVRVDFAKGETPPDVEVRRFVKRHGYKILDTSLTITVEAGAMRWHFLMFTRDRKAASAELFARELAMIPGVEGLDVAHARNST